jgi:hypothetical protein
MESGDTTWAIAAGNIRNDAEKVANAIKMQGGRYMLKLSALRVNAIMRRSRRFRKFCRGSKTLNH